jgi:predicted MPP superfamily phosphohydrolase
VRLPIIGALKAQNPLSNKLDMGLWDAARLSRALRRDVTGRTQLYITRGVGVARFRQYPLYPRLLCPPEVTWITLRACAHP